MKNLDYVAGKLEALSTIAYYIESAAIECTVNDEDSHAANRLIDLVAVMKGQIQQILSDFDEVAGHIEVCNAIYAVNNVNELKTEIARLKHG